MALWTVAPQARLSRGFPRQKEWSGLPLPPPGDLPDPEIKPLIGRWILHQSHQGSSNNNLEAQVILLPDEVYAELFVPGLQIFSFIRVIEAQVKSCC